METKIRIAVLVASFNRAQTTVAGLASLFQAAAEQSLATLEVFLLDDASPDGTGEIVKRKFPMIHVLEGTGNLFWNRGMCRAYCEAKRRGPFDAYLLYNDDVLLRRDALYRMISTYQHLQQNKPAAVVGAMCSRETGATTYSGFNIISRFRVSTFAKVPPNGTLRECDTFNGNCVLIPAPAMDAVGGLDPAYHHSYGDIDLGLMLKRRECKTFLLEDHIGYCELNSPRRPPHLLARIKNLFRPPHPVSDQIHLAYKRFSFPIATGLAFAQIAKRLVHAINPSAG